MKQVLIYTLAGSVGALLAILLLEELGTVLPFWAYMTLPILILSATCKRGLKNAALSSAISALLMISFYYCPWPSRRHFLHDLRRIQIGMSTEDVEAIMKSYHKGTGWPSLYGAGTNTGVLTDLGGGNRFQTTSDSAGELALQNCIVYRHDLREADWGIIEFKSNRVTGVSFSPD